MSSIAVRFHRDAAPVHEHALARMLAAAPYRAPEGTTVQILGEIGVGCGRMSVSPEDGPRGQGSLTGASGAVIVADVRLDNRAELLVALADLPHDAPDPAIVLRAYEAWGLDAVARLLGDFAFVLWDPRRARLIAARDSSGQRSLFYRVDARTFVAASEIQMLLQEPTARLVASEERIRDFLTPFNFHRNEKDQATTFYDGIFALPAGHLLVVGREMLRLHRYWEFAPRELRYRRSDEYDAHFRALFASVIQSRLRSSGPIAALLSGGLDSSSIVGVARRLETSARPMLSFTLALAGEAWDEHALVAEMVKSHGLDAHYLTPDNLAGRLQPRPRGFLESPNMGIPSARDAMFAAVRAAGVRVVLTGDIADACIGGSPLVFDSLLKRGRLTECWTRFRAYRHISAEPLRRTLVLGCAVPLLPLRLVRLIEAEHVERLNYDGGIQLVPSWMPLPLRVELGRRHIETARQAALQRRFANPAREYEYRMLYPPEIARHPAPWPVEMRRPFADRRLHEFLLAIPPEEKFGPRPDRTGTYGASKRLLRRALRGVVPDRILSRTTKTRFSGVIAREMTRNWAAYEEVFGPGSRPHIAERGYIDRDLFWSRLQAFRDGALGPDQMYVMQLAALETWLRAIALPWPRSVTVPPPWRDGETSSSRDPAPVGADVLAALRPDPRPGERCV